MDKQSEPGPGEPKLEKINIAKYAARLTEPFTMIDLVSIDDIVLSIFLCQGTLPRHRHMDQDELFLVYSGTISLESDWGTVILRPGELAVAPKGLGHRSSSLLHSLVLLLQPRLMVNRRNGDRRLFRPKTERGLDKVNIEAVGRQIAIPFRAVVLADLDTYALQLSVCYGTGPWNVTDHQDSPLLCYEGRVVLETEQGRLPLEEGELVLVPKGCAYRLSSVQRSLIIDLRRHDSPGLP
jgi:mannose-6-phosphate isomerase-like protein (cupin superfamily)